ncbi:hypothetical protein ERC79_01835 [Rhodococcus sp. ABRD24]|uniref:hypothetical protein n=1 Tax=Rhodococcus sp. ABRD24 TaxID=2507582 RepID=UPI00103A2776|nr:hypothetical protein [Rhodococcus sp. ABRD24]QBJ94846.1 hypothetical protein ERC79_01835 [Rhodococcus sp. ABRD24]
MAMSKIEDRVIQQVIKAHGPTLDLEAHPEVLVEIVRKWAFDLVGDGDAGVKPGGVGPVGPTSLEAGPELEDILKAVISLQRQVDKISRQLED